MTASPASPAVIAAPTAPVRRRTSPRRNFMRSAPGVIGVSVLLILVVIALAAPLIAPDNPLRHVGQALEQPSAHHWFGTDELGRDLFSRVIYGTRLSLETAIGAAVLAGVIGLPIGIITGYLGGAVDAIVMRITDFVLAVPGILFALVVVATLGSGVFKLTLAIGFGSIPAFIRLARASTLSLRNTEYVAAARSMGAPKRDIMFRTIMPNILPPIFVQVVVTASVATLVAAALSFVGLGTPPPAPSWGGMLQASRSYLYQQIWYAILPGAALAITVAALDGVGRGLERALGTQTSLKSSGAMG